MNLSRLFLFNLGLAASSTAYSQSPPPDAAWVNQLFTGMKLPLPPRHLVANIYHVGTMGVSVYLIKTPAGDILLDTSFEDTVPLIQKNIEQLGFKLTDIKLILSSHAHIDHVGGHAQMKKLTGARIVASAADAKTLASGGADDFIQWPRETILYPPVKADQIVGDGEKITLGGVTLTANLTPGHTRGATSWTMDVTDKGKIYRVVFFSSASINAGTRLVGNPIYPKIAEDFAATFAKLKAMPCDIFFAPHGGQFGMTEKFARLDRGTDTSPFIDPARFRAQVAQFERAFRQQLEQETAAQAKSPTP